jgi:hypothetical protein
MKTIKIIKIKKIWVIAILSIFSLTACDTRTTYEIKSSFKTRVKENEIKEGINYTKLKKPIKDAKNITLFFWYGSESSFILEDMLIKWLNEKEVNKLPSINIIPGISNPLWETPAKIYETLSYFKKNNELSEDLYKHFIINKKISNEELLQILAKHKIDTIGFQEIYSSNELMKKIDDDKSIGEQAELIYVPSVIINGVYQIDIFSFNSFYDVFVAIDFLLNKK